MFGSVVLSRWCVMAMAFAPMLATSKRVAEIPSGWVAEPKLDGWRALVIVRDGRVHVRSRRGNDLTDRLPELLPLAMLSPIARSSTANSWPATGELQTSTRSGRG